MSSFAHVLRRLLGTDNPFPFFNTLGRYRNRWQNGVLAPVARPQRP
jgi:hypothetical protein